MKENRIRTEGNPRIDTKQKTNRNDHKHFVQYYCFPGGKKGTSIHSDVHEETMIVSYKFRRINSIEQ